LEIYQILYHQKSVNMHVTSGLCIFYSALLNMYTYFALYHDTYFMVYLYSKTNYYYLIASYNR
jgi:hypothetical protein